MKPPTPQIVNTHRADSYTMHYACRRQIMDMPTEISDLYVRASKSITMPRLTAFGGTDYERHEIDHLIMIAVREGLYDAWLINPWYTTEEGWQAFQKLWQSLPEVIHKTDVDNLGELPTYTQEDQYQASLLLATRA
jgi:hypothetical protein